MAIELLGTLVSVSLVSSIAILLVGLLRKPLRIASGAQSAYWLWLLVPTSAAAIFMPARPLPMVSIPNALPDYANAIFSSPASASVASGSLNYAVICLLLWLGGGAAMGGLLWRRQSRFVRSLGQLSPVIDGLTRSRNTVAPMLMGVCKPRIVVPVDFEDRYSEAERGLVLAHERAHLLRGDVQVNALAAAWLCVSWFNPLIYWAIGRLRLDQELACDALVLKQSATPARIYAQALLKTQLTNEAAWRQPIGCHWQSIHPLTERVAMLKRRHPGFLRRCTGLSLALGVTLFYGLAVWASTSTKPASNPPILIHLKLTVTHAKDISAQEVEFLVDSSEVIQFPMGIPYDARCIAFLPVVQGVGSLGWDKHAPDGQPAPSSGQILLECMIRNQGEVVATPAVITMDGESATVDFVNTEHASRFRLEETATTSKEKIAAARIAAKTRAARKN